MIFLINKHTVINIISYMKGNKKSIAIQVGKKQIKSHIFHRSTVVAENIINVMMRLVEQKIKIIQSLKEKQNNQIKYSKIECQRYFYSYLNQMLMEQPHGSHFQRDKQPQKIEIDTLAISCLTKTVSQSVILTPKSIRSISQSRQTQLPLLKRQIKKQQSIQLTLETIQEANFEKELRQKKLNEELAIKQKQMQSSMSLKNYKGKSRDINVNFDYDGQVIQKKNIKHGVLIHRVIEEKLKQQKILKKVHQSPEPLQISPIEKQKYIRRNKSKVIQSEFTQFLDSQSLTESIEINRGIRYSHNALVFQEKKTILSKVELKNMLGKLKISKNQFQKIKQLNDKRSIQKSKKTKTQVFKDSNFSHKRSYSQANFRNSRNSKRDIINILNPQLRSSMLIRLSQYEPYLVIEKSFPEDLSLIYDQKPPLLTQNVSQISMNEIDTLSKIFQNNKMSTILPPIDLKKIFTPNEDDLILTKLQRQLQNKLKI